jgi:predicted nucleotidyltransferase
MLRRVTPTSDDEFCARAGARLGELPGVVAVSLGGSRAAGTARPDSDWDFAVYYRGPGFDPDSLRSLGWPGRIFPIGGWGGGVFNGGAWLTAGDRQVDVHYRDLDDVEFRIAEACAGRFRIERLQFHLAGIPTYIVVGELAVNVVLHGELPSPGYPDRLRAASGPPTKRRSSTGRVSGTAMRCWTACARNRRHCCARWTPRVTWSRRPPLVRASLGKYPGGRSGGQPGRAVGKCGRK